jgi:hypothetical protein
MTAKAPVPYHNEHWNLLQHLAKTLDLKNDAAIARAMGTEPPIVSKVRHGRSTLSNLMLMRVMELLGLTPEGLKFLMGSGAYMTAVWGQDPTDRSLNFKAMDADPAYKVQTEVVTTLTMLIRQHGYAILKTGQRSGKSIIEARVAHRMGAEHIYLYAKGMHLAKVFPEYVDVTLNGRLPDSKDQAPAHSLVVIDEAFWIPDSIDIMVDAIDRNLPVLVVGSNGPQMEARGADWINWTNALSFNTWDLNPMVTRQSLQMQYDADPFKAKRDYEAF